MQSLLSHGGHNRKRDGIPSNPAGFTSVLVYARRFTHRKYKKKGGKGRRKRPERTLLPLLNSPSFRASLSEKSCKKYRGKAAVKNYTETSAVGRADSSNFSILT